MGILVFLGLQEVKGPCDGSLLSSFIMDTRLLPFQLTDKEVNILYPSEEF